MRRKLESFSFTGMHLLILMVSVVTLIFAAQPYQVYASSNNDNDNDNENENENGNSDNDGGSRSDGESRENLIDQLCRFARTNPTLAELAASALGFPGVGAATNALCSLGN